MEAGGGMGQTGRVRQRQGRWEVGVGLVISVPLGARVKGNTLENKGKGVRGGTFVYVPRVGYFQERGLDNDARGK